MMVRGFASHDLAAIVAIQARCPDTAQWCEEDYRRMAADPNGAILVAELPGAPSPQVAGYAALQRIGEEAELRNLAVEPRHQRTGIARALLDAGIGAMARFGVRQLFLEVRVSNQPARALYRAVGFRLLSTRRHYYHDPDDDALVMAIDIIPPSGFILPPQR
jgi:[ribosomal protein S18]-alanine N-acetyltransferase